MSDLIKDLRADLLNGWPEDGEPVLRMSDMRQFVATKTIEKLCKEYDDMKRLKDADIERLKAKIERLNFAQTEKKSFSDQHDMFEKSIDKMSERELRAECRHLRHEYSVLRTSLEQTNNSLKKLVKRTELGP